ncbi:plasma membrane fusion protein prm1, partial [Coemansia nantahalensis]
SPPRRYDEKQRMPSPGRRPDMRPPPDRRHTPPHGRYDEKHPHRPPGGPPDRDRRQAQGVISPYIGKWAKLSRVWTSQTVIMIVFMAVGYMLMADAARRMAADTAAGMLAACGALDSAANHVVNAPNQAALSMLGLLTEGALDVVRLAEKTLIQIIDIFRDIIVWVLKLYVGTFICFAELIIRTALAMVAEASKLLTEALNKALDSVMPVLQNVAATVAGGVQDAANKVIGFFGGGGDNGPKVDFKPDDIRKELNVQIPTDWVDSISSLQDKIPTEQELFGDFTAVLDIPFSFIRNALTAAFASVHIDFVDGVNLPLDKKANVCEGPMGQDVILEMGDVVAKIFFFGGLLMLGVAAGIMLFNAFMRFQTRLVEFRHELIEYDPPQSARAIAERPATRREMDMFVLPGSPWLDRFTKMLVRKMGNGERAAAWRWWLHYVWHPPAIACFIAGAIGLLSILGQIYAINTLRHEYVPRLARELTEFQVSLGAKLIAPVRDESVALTGGINGNVSAKEGDLNRTMFGPVNDGTSKVNDTLNEFVKSYIDGIRKTFGGTPLQQPIEGLVNCTLTRNIQSIQKVIGYVNGFASGFHLPRISEDVLLNPVEKLIRPLNATAQNFREFAVGYYIPHADRLDPNSFPELDEEAMLSSKEAKIQSMAEKYKNEHPTAGTPTTAPTPSASSNSEPGQAGAHRKRQQSGLDGGSQEPRATQDSSGRGQSAAQHPSSSAESSGELGEL